MLSGKAFDQDEITHLKRYYGEEYFNELGLNLGEAKHFIAVGCNECGNSGYHGRVGIHELLVNSAKLKSLIFDRTSTAILRDQALKEGMRTLI